ncbi:MAG: hypothetical protein COB36_09055 [Alphaproteobacteria bacterium]|nr:MAG: hypothetical protein COB36_09055 [Alphaproteobacteria bacterium]
MSAVKKTAKVGLYLLSFFVVLLIGGAVYLYTNMDSLAKQLTEQIASDALGVPVHVGEMKITLEDLKIVVQDIRIANPKGYENPNAITIKSIVIDGDNFSRDLLTFSHISVSGTHVNLEVDRNGTNLGDIKSNIANSSSPTSSGHKNTGDHKEDSIKVVVKKFSLTGAQISPSVTLLEGDLPTVTVPDIHLTGIGQKENGILAEEAIAQIMDAVLQEFNKSANGAGFLEGVSLKMLNSMGVSTADVFKKNLKKSYNKEVEGFKKGFGELKSLFE